MNSALCTHGRRAIFARTDGLFTTYLMCAGIGVAIFFEKLPRVRWLFSAAEFGYDLVLTGWIGYTTRVRCISKP